MNEDNITNFILEPLSVIIKLAILSKKEAGSKICVYNNALCIQEAGIFQSLVRFVYHNNKIDIQYLYNPIYHAVNKYIKYDNIKSLFTSAEKGLDILIELYKDHLIVVHSLIFYKNLISNPKIFVEDGISSLYNEQILNKFNSIWTSDKIKIVLDMLEYINKDNQSDRSIRCLEEFIALTDEKVRSIMKEMNLIVEPEKEHLPKIVEEKENDKKEFAITTQPFEDKIYSSSITLPQIDSKYNDKNNKNKNKST